MTLNWLKKTGSKETIDNVGEIFQKICNSDVRNKINSRSKCTKCQRDLKKKNNSTDERNTVRIIEICILHEQFLREWSLRYTHMFALKNKSRNFRAEWRVSCYIFSLAFSTARYNHPQSVVEQELWNWLSTPSLSHSPLSSRTNFVPAQSGVRLFELILTSAL